MSEKKEEHSEEGDGEKKERRSERSEHIRNRIQASIDQAKEERRRELFKKRIELARTGLKNFEEHRITDASKAFLTYIDILEDWKKVAKGNLSPACFESKKEGAELLLVSGVYWDLAKLYDRTRSQERQREFRHFMDQYVRFSKNMPYESLCRETLRKYIVAGKPVHREEFMRAFKLLNGRNCFIATALSDEIHKDTLDRLRGLRDGFLSRHQLGRRFIFYYYSHAPGFVPILLRMPRPVKRSLAITLDFLGWFGR